MNNGSHSTQNPVRVALLLGGDSSERAISIKTGNAMRDALDDARFHVETFDVASFQSEKVDGATFVSWRDLTTILIDFDVVLSGLHGGWGEDGTLQSLLEIVGVPYVGSGQRASTIAMDKQLCKTFLREFGLTVPRGVVVIDEDAARPFSGSCVVKPNDGGSSVGVTILGENSDENAWRQALRDGLREGAILVEEAVVGTEVTCPVWGEGDLARALPVIEIVPQSDGNFYDFAAKYALGGSQHLIPPRLSESVQQRVQNDALKAHRALGCRGVSRSDFLVKSDGTPVFLEINTLPGMTETSLVPDAARAAGITFPQLIQSLVDDALRSISSTRLASQEAGENR